MRHAQSRLCFTLSYTSELFDSVIRGLIPSEHGPVFSEGSHSSHADLFGPFSLSIDPIIARRMGVVPTNYYSPSDMFGLRYDKSVDKAPGLNIQMIQSLKEIRELLILHAIIERSIDMDGGLLLDEKMLKALNLDLPFERELLKKAYQLSECKRREIFRLFDTDRPSALNLVSFTEMMLSLFQETDSTIDGSVLAFYQQREWRLIHHMRRGMSWFSLGKHPHVRNPLAYERATEIATIKESLESFGGSRSESYFQQCWVLEEVDGVPIRDYFVGVVVPERARLQAKKLLKQSGCSAELIAAEEFGFSN